MVLYFVSFILMVNLFLLFYFIGNPMFCCMIMILYVFSLGHYFLIMLGFSWMFYMFLTIFMGGIIIMFTFFCSILPNENYYSNISMYMFFSFIVFSCFMMFDLPSDSMGYMKSFYSTVGMSYFFALFIFLYFVFFSYYTFSEGFSMRSYFFFFSLSKIWFL